jgi:voltage-gated potassium channel
MPKCKIVDKLYSLLITSAVVIVTGSILILTIESGKPGSQINSELDAVWWTVSTVSTVGFGDIVPVTDAGKIMAIFFMLFGISILGIFLSVLGTRFYKRQFEKNENDLTLTQEKFFQRIDDLEKNQKELQKDLRDLIEKLKQNS